MQNLFHLLNVYARELGEVCATKNMRQFRQAVAEFQDPAQTSSSSKNAGPTL
jgi:hypothetical protein